MRNVGVRVAPEQEPQLLGVYMGFFILVPWVWELLGH